MIRRRYVNPLDRHTDRSGERQLRCSEPRSRSRTRIPGTAGCSLLAPSLLTFNLGVELGQLVVVALAWPFLRWLRGVRGLWPGGIRWSSVALAGLGTFWVVQRLVSPG